MKQISIKRFRKAREAANKILLIKRILASDLTTEDKLYLTKPILSEVIPEINVLLDTLCDNHIVDKGF